MQRHTFRVSGMSCSGCESAVENGVGALTGVEEVAADHETDTVSVTGGEAGEVVAAIDDAGYEVVAAIEDAGHEVV